MNCPICTTLMVMARASNFGEEYPYCRTCKKELAEMGSNTPLRTTIYDEVGADIFPSGSAHAIPAPGPNCHAIDSDRDANPNMLLRPGASLPCKQVSIYRGAKVERIAKHFWSSRAGFNNGDPCRCGAWFNPHGVLSWVHAGGSTEVGISPKNAAPVPSSSPPAVAKYGPCYTGADGMTKHRALTNVGRSCVCGAVNIVPDPNDGPLMTMGTRSGRIQTKYANLANAPRCEHGEPASDACPVCAAKKFMASHPSGSTVVGTSLDLPNKKGKPWTPNDY